MNNQFDLNKFNSFIESANNTISCNSECQKNNTIQQLKDKLVQAESNLVLADPEFEIAQKNYYTYVSGQSGYNELIQQELNEKAELFITTFKDNYKSEIGKIETELGTLTGILVNYRNIEDLYTQYKEENIELFQQLKDENNDVLTNDRKTYYENQQIDGLNSIYYYIIWIIYIIILICFAVFSFFYPSKFSFKIRLLLLIIFIILPYISTFLLGKIIQFFYWLFGLLPKNVYK
jgi:hypothetical protein